MNYKQMFSLWLDNAEDEGIKKRLLEMSESEIKDAFLNDLQFGTAGLRGKMDAGTACMNIYTVRQVSRAIAGFLLTGGNKSVVISYDSRIDSDTFAHAAAEVFADSGIKVYITNELMPSPFLSYAVRELKTGAGIMITASHNPKEYNGYKVYGSDGCQLTDADAAIIFSYIKKTDPFSIKTAGFNSYLKNNKIKYTDHALTKKYLAKVLMQGKARADGVKIMYTPLNGTGYKLIPLLLKNKGADVLTVAGQDLPDGNFPLCPNPNPEKKETLMIGINAAIESGCDLLIATDPDADRVGVAVIDSIIKDGYTILTGNEIGVLLTEYLLRSNRKAGTLPKNPFIIRTIVTTTLADKIASKYGAEVKEVLTGFKYIGELIGKKEKAGEADDFILGFEESCGYLSGSYVRDKDAVLASMLIAEMAAEYKKDGKTLLDAIEEIYEEFGKYYHKTLSYAFKGADGTAKIASITKNLRQNPLKDLGGEIITSIIDYICGHDGLPPADVLLYNLSGGCSVIIRPSGTEPLIKAYITTAGKSGLDLQEKIIIFLDRIFSE